MSLTISPRILWGAAAILAVVAAVRVSGAASADESALTCGPGAVVVHVGTRGDGVPLPMAVATAAPTRSVADVAAANKLEPTSTLAPNALGSNCLIIGHAPAAAKVAAPGK